MSELRTLLDRLTIIEGAAEADVVIARLLAFDRPRVLSFLNQHALNLAARNTAFRNDLLGADTLLRDGAGVEVALRVLGREPGFNANGTDLIPRLLSRSAGRPVALFGTREPWLGLASRATSASGGRVVATLDGFQPDEAYSDLVESTMPEIIVLGMGMPRQERLACRLAALGGSPRLIVNGGAVLDFYAGRFRRAPIWLRRARLEWAFRLAQEPRRLCSRYISGGGQFAVTVARLRAGAP